eukprot:TRINITY_DN59852_c0_g1_i1.p1 TRINITY_DN59852_c0_g1~~TRINITY_DN59852_c0_g1_i1.p1  ORF type:complete len:435 (-),score=95.10 TRINITY_DN59852_c0_g1_i1:298-1602(-)
MRASRNSAVVFLKQDMVHSVSLCDRQCQMLPPCWRLMRREMYASQDSYANAKHHALPAAAAFFASAGCLTQIQRSKRVAVSCGAGGEMQFGHAGPAELESIPGQKAQQLLLENLALFEDDLEREFKCLASSSNQKQASDNGAAVSSDSDAASLRLRILEVQRSERGRALSELLYLMVCKGFRSVGVPLARATKSGGRADLGPAPDVQQRLAQLHSSEALAAISEHLRRSFPGLSGPEGDGSSALPVRLTLFNLGQAYATSILYGYVLCRAEDRLKLERSFQPQNFTGSDRPLEDYIESIGTGKFQDTMVTLEAHLAAELQVCGAFGDLQQLKEQLHAQLSSRLQKSVSSCNDSLRDQVRSALQDAIVSGEVASLDITGADLRRLLAEAVAFGSLLFWAETQAQEMCDLTLVSRSRLDKFGIETDSDGNPVLPPS